MTNAAAFTISAAAVIFAIFIGGRFQAVPSGGSGPIYIVDRLTGSATVCFSSGCRILSIEEAAK